MNTWRCVEAAQADALAVLLRACLRIDRLGHVVLLMDLCSSFGSFLNRLATDSSYLIVLDGVGGGAVGKIVMAPEQNDLLDCYEGLQSLTQNLLATQRPDKRWQTGDRQLHQAFAGARESLIQPHCWELQ